MGLCDSEYDEFKHERDAHAPLEKLEDEMGDILFAAVNLARFHKINPEVALNRATQKFLHRYRLMESLATAPLNTLPFETLDALWTQAKQQLQSAWCSGRFCSSVSKINFAIWQAVIKISTDSRVPVL